MIPLLEMKQGPQILRSVSYPPSTLESEGVKRYGIVVTILDLAPGFPGLIPGLGNTLVS